MMALLDKYKARLVARGFTQREGIDFNETFAPSSRQESLKDFLFKCGFEDWELSQLDVVGAFLYGLLNEEIYMTQPEGFEDPRFPDNVWLLNASLYGLKQAARQCNIKFTSHLKSLGFTCSAYDPSLYHKTVKNKLVAAILLHVDDVLIASKSQDLKREIQAGIEKEFKITSSESVTEFLSFDIERNRAERKFSLSQSSYVRSLVERFNMENEITRPTPCDDEFKKLEKNSDVEKKTRMPYMELVGGLQWLSCSSRIDISFAVNRLAQFGTCPTDEHWNAALNVLRYLKGSPNLKLILGGRNKILSGHSDSDWAENHEDRRSTTGFLYRLGNSIISWKSRNQPTVALSSTEPEYMAMTDALREGIWWRGVLRELELFEDDHRKGERSIDPYTVKGKGQSTPPLYSKGKGLSPSP